MPTWDNVSLDQPNVGNFKHILPANVPTQETMSTLTNPAKKSQTHTTANASTHEIQSASDQPRIKYQTHTTCKYANTQTWSASDQLSKENVKHILPANAHTQDSVSLRSTQQGECQAHTCCEHINAQYSVSLRLTQQGKCQAHTTCKHKTQSASNQLHTEQREHQAHTSYKCTNTQPQSASDQPSKDNVKHIQSVNTQTHELSQAQINPAKKMTSTYHLQTLVSSDQPKKKIVKHIQPANTLAWDYLTNREISVQLSTTSRTHGIGETSHCEKWYGNDDYEQTHVGFEKALDEIWFEMEDLSRVHVLWNFYYFRHHVLSRVTSMLLDFTPYALCHMLHPFTLCLSFDLIFIVIVDVICLLIPYPELHRISAYSPITHLWLHPQLRSITAPYAPLTLLVSYLLSHFIFIPYLIIQSDGTIFPYLV